MRLGDSKATIYLLKTCYNDFYKRHIETKDLTIQLDQTPLPGDNKGVTLQHLYPILPNLTTAEIETLTKQNTDTPDDLGWTPLFFSATNENKAILESLLTNSNIAHMTAEKHNVLYPAVWAQRE